MRWEKNLLEDEMFLELSPFFEKPHFDYDVDKPSQIATLKNLQAQSRLYHCVVSAQSCESVDLTIKSLTGDSKQDEALKAENYFKELVLSLKHVEKRFIKESQSIAKVSVHSYLSGDKESAEFGRKLLETLADVGLSLTPGVNVGRDAYELLTGIDLVTGEKLSRAEKVQRAVGVLSLGSFSYVKGGIKLITKVGQSLLKNNKLILKSASNIVNSARKLGAKTQQGIKDLAHAFNNVVGK